MTTYFTSDTHWGHKNIIKYANRPYSSVQEMDEALIKNWNSVVGPKDEVWHLGDVTFHNAKQITNILWQLNGVIHYIRGNHDEVMNGRVLDRFRSVNDYKEIHVDGQKLVLMHFPLLTWNKAHRGSWMLHGHCHGNIDDLNLSTTRLDVGVDSHGYKPISFAEVQSILSKREYDYVDHHRPDAPSDPEQERVG